MVLNVVSLFVGFLCLLVVFLMLLNQKPNQRTNGYLVVILIAVGLQHFLYAIEVLGLTNYTYSPLKIKPILAFSIVPVYYLFFIRLINNKGILKKELLHFIFPTSLIVMNVFVADYSLNRIFYMGYSIFYFVLILIIVKKFMSRKNTSMLDKLSYQAKKTWLLLMIALTFLLIVFSNYFTFIDLTTQVHLNYFYRYSSIVWLALLLYMFKNPVIIFGEQTLLKNIQSTAPQEFKIWSNKPLQAVTESDKIVNQILSNRIDLIIYEIKKLQKSAPLISKITLNSETLAKELKMPKRHLDFVFKYYCHYSVNDFSNLVKVNYAISLINNGYLEKFTVASLGEKCLFNSRFTFSKNFKKFVGVSVSDFVDHHTLVKA